MILMSRDNPDGHKLEDLLETVIGEIEVKAERIASDKGTVALRLQVNARAMVALLREAAAIQRDSLAALDTIGPDQGPRGVPRIGG